MSVRIEHGDCREIVKSLAEASVHAVVTDPPYSLVSIQKRFGKPGQAAAQFGKDGLYQRASRGFMGKQWDTGETAFDPDFWRGVYRVLKPGAHVVAFGGTRTYHRLVCAIEDAGFEIRDQLAWLFGSGFPKSHNLRDVWDGWGTALKPAHEPIVLARKPLIGTVAANVLEHGTGGLNIDACRVIATEGDEPFAWETPRGGIWRTDARARAQPQAQHKGRWPANLCHDGSEEVVAAFPASDGQQGDVRGTEPSAPFNRVYGNIDRSGSAAVARRDSGSAARFFYSAKADRGDRLGSKHPTIKPVNLMRWLVRLVTPPNGAVLDPFAGTGTTGMACMAEGFGCILIEREAEYVADIVKRIAHVSGENTPLFAGNEQ